MMTKKNINIHVTEKLVSRRTGHVKTWQVCQIEGRDQRRWRRGEGLREIKQALFGLQGAKIMEVISHQNHLMLSIYRIVLSLSTSLFFKQLEMHLLAKNR